MGSEEEWIGESLMNTDDITMVVHGPEVFDCGDVAWLMACLTPRVTLVAGVMARTAAEESGLPVEFVGEPPSAILRRIPGRTILVNRGKTAESGKIFGEIVSSRLAEGQGLVQLECSSHTVYLWNHTDVTLGEEIALTTGFQCEQVVSRMGREPRRREIRGCLPGEPVCVNGIVIGRATARTVVLEEIGESILPVSGLIPKAHGMEKLHRIGLFDLSRAWCKSGQIRSRAPALGSRRTGAGRVVVIDHCGHEIFRELTSETGGVLAIGDDTTRVCGHICSHRGIPVLGIVDGDADHLVDTAYAPGSVIVEVTEERDDEVGKEVALLVPPNPIQWEEWVTRALSHLSTRGRVIYRC